MVSIGAFIGDFQHIGFRFYGSNSIGILCCFLDVALQSVLIDTDLIILTVFLTFHAIIYSNDIVNRFSSSNGVGIIILNGIDELIFVNTHGVIVITVIINHFSNIYITFAVCLCGSNGVSIILLYKIAQLVAVDINLIRMIAIGAFIGDFQHIGFCFYGSNSISPGNAFQLISYPAAGSNAIYLCLHAVLVGILNLYRQLAIFIQASFHTGIDSISINNILQLIVYPTLRSNAIYAVGVNSAGIISNIGSQRAVCKGQFIGCNLGIGINNGCSKYLIIRSYQLIGIDCLALTGSCSNRFNNCILQACLACFTVNGLCHGNIICIERFDNSVKFTYRNLRHRLLALHFGIITLMYRYVTKALRIPLSVMGMINKRCEQFNLLAGADLYLRVSQICPEISGSIMSLRSINLSCSVFGNFLVNRGWGRSVSPHGSITHHAHCHNCCQHALCQSSLLSSLFHFQSPFSTLRHSDASLILVKSISLIKYNSDKVVLKFKALKI